MSIKTKLVELRSAIGTDDAEERSRLTGSILTDLEAEFNLLSDAKEVVDKSDIKRKGTISELREALDKAEGKNTSLEDKIKLMEDDDSIVKENKELKEQNDAYKTQIDDSNKIKRESYIRNFKAISEHADFENIKEKIKVPEEKDGKIDFKDMSDDDIFANADVVQKAKDFGLFGDIKPGISTHKGGEAGKKKDSDGPFRDSDIK